MLVMLDNPVSVLLNADSALFSCTHTTDDDIWPPVARGPELCCSAMPCLGTKLTSNKVHNHCSVLYTEGGNIYTVTYVMREYPKWFIGANVCGLLMMFEIVLYIYNHMSGLT